MLATVVAGTVSCRYARVEPNREMVAHIYSGGSIDRHISFTPGKEAPKEVQDWIKFNNTKLYHWTMAYYVPRLVLSCPGQYRCFDFYRDSVQDGSFIRRATEEDAKFVAWLKAQAPDKPCPKCKGERWLLSPARDKWLQCPRCNGTGRQAAF